MAMTEQTTDSGFGCPAFDTASEPISPYPSTAEQNALVALRRALLGGKAITLLLGVEGIGKTQLLESIRSRLSENLHIASIRLEEFEADATAEADAEVEEHVVDDFVASIRDFVAEEQADPAEEARSALLVVDDAHRLPDSALSQLLAVCQELSDADPPVRLLLAGEPDLQDRLHTWHDGAFSAFLGEEILVATFSQQDTAGYVAHRFAQADCDCHKGRNPFDAGAMARLHDYSGGIPGRIGDVASHALREANRLGVQVIGAPFVDACQSGDISARVAELPGFEPANPAPDGPARPEEEPTRPMVLSFGTAPDATVSSVPRPVRSRGWLWTLASGMVLAGLAGGLVWNQLAGRDNPIALQEPGGPVMTPNLPGEVPPRPEPVDLPPPPELPKISLATLPETRDLLAQAADAAMEDPAYAVLLYERAALLGDERAAYYLGQIYETGVGVAMDPLRARAWYRQAEDNERAAARLEELGPPGDPGGSGAAVLPSLHVSLPDGRVMLHWQTLTNETAARFAVESVGGDPSAPARRHVTDLSAALLEGPVSRWRIVTLSENEQERGATDWFDAPPLLD